MAESPSDPESKPGALATTRVASAERRPAAVPYRQAGKALPAEKASSRLVVALTERRRMTPMQKLGLSATVVGMATAATWRAVSAPLVGIPMLVGIVVLAVV